MKKIVELPLIEPIYSTYHYQGSGTVIYGNNLSIRNWYLNNAVNLTCQRDFLFGVNTPRISIVNSNWTTIPCFESYWYITRFLKGSTGRLIREFLDQGYYVYFSGVDDYYIKGKTFYKKRHFKHDGLICGYNQEDKTYCVFAYDEKWVYNKFWIPQKSFEIGRQAGEPQNYNYHICGIKAKDEEIKLDCEVILKNIKEYLDSSLEKYPPNECGDVFGIVVHDYIAMYIDKICNGDITFENVDKRVFRLIWEHKKAMEERIEKVEQQMKLNSNFSKKYKKIVAESDKTRMIFAAYLQNNKVALLPLIKGKLIHIKNNENKLLEKFVLKIESEMRKNAVENN